MKSFHSIKKNLSVTIVGTIDFQRQLSSLINQNPSVQAATLCNPLDAWSEVIASKPNCLFVELNLNHSSKTQAWLKEFLRSVKDRFKQNTHVTVVLTAPERLIYGGDLLFQDDVSLDPSGLVDSFVAQAPWGFPDIQSIDSQIEQVLTLLSLEIERRDQGMPELPPLAADGWVHSLADPLSRELWMLWLPRYASYTNENPIITGPTGSGKTRLAKALHILSGRTGPFISITPRDFSSSELIQAELFGAVAGAYTGAVDKWGLVKGAENGTLFIDELQSIDKDLQGKLITFIENKTYRRVGSAETIQANVRFVFATNRTISEMVATDTLRDDFAYRLERVQLNLPALSERRLDIAAGLAYALAKIRRQRPMSTLVTGLTSDAYRLLFGYSWPGNLRQLENAVAKLCERADLGGELLISESTVRDVFGQSLDSQPMNSAELYAAAARHLSSNVTSESFKSINDAVIDFKNAIRSTALELSGGDSALAAELLQEPKNLLDLFIEAKVTNNRLSFLTSK